MSLANNPQHCEWDRYKRYPWTNIKNILGKFKKTKTNIKKKCQQWALQTTLTVNDQETARRQPFARRCTSCTSYWALCNAFCMPCICAAYHVFLVFAVYLCCILYIGFAHHVFLAVHSVFHLQRMFCAEYHKHLETTHFRYESPIMGKSKIFSKWPPPFSAPKSQLELLLHDIVYLREPLVCSLTYFILCT